MKLGEWEAGEMVASARWQNRRAVPRARFPDRYSLGYPAEYMALVYNAADVPLAASNEEAFQYS